MNINQPIHGAEIVKQLYFIHGLSREEAQLILSSLSRRDSNPMAKELHKRLNDAFMNITYPVSIGELKHPLAFTEFDCRRIFTKSDEPIAKPKAIRLHLFSGDLPPIVEPWDFYKPTGDEMHIAPSAELQVAADNFDFDLESPIQSGIIHAVVPEMLAAFDQLSGGQAPRQNSMEDGYKPKRFPDPRCKARQVPNSDLIVCDDCCMSWGANDLETPECQQ